MRARRPKLATRLLLLIFSAPVPNFAASRSAFDLAAAQYQRALASTLLSDFEECERLLRKSVASSSGSERARALLLLGSVTGAMERREEAVASFEAALPELPQRAAATARFVSRPLTPP